MAKKDFSSHNEAKIELGKIIAKYRAGRSLRSLAVAIGIPASNVTYIERGINAPSADVYIKLIRELQPSEKDREIMDGLYSEIRHLPAPQVCNIILENDGLGDAIKKLEGKKLTRENLKAIQQLFLTF